MTIFDGNAAAQKREAQVLADVQHLRDQGKLLNIAAVLFVEDAGSRLYTGLKKQAAERVGIGYQVAEFSMNDEPQVVLDKIFTLNRDSSVTGIIIQKPWRSRWMEVTGKDTVAFTTWWQLLVNAIAETKDVDGLHPSTLELIARGEWQSAGRVLPATVQAVLSILEEAGELDAEALAVARKVVILGKSDILGLPLSFELKNRGFVVELLGTKELEARLASGQALLDADIVVAATGRANLVTGNMIKTGAVVIDVGEPKPDVEFATVAPKASFITPVPGGVGPMTVISLLKNCVKLRSMLI